MLLGHNVAYEHADGHVLFSKLNFNFPSGGSALVGANGIGKSVLARLLAGVLEPSAGTIKRSGAVLYLPQIEAAPPLTLAEYLLGLWEAPPERQAVILKLLRDLPMDQNLTQLSGGEWMRVRISEALLHGADFLILDEPSNNLDTQARDLIADLLKSAEFSFLLISHDRNLLRQVERIYELSTKGLQLYGGAFDFYAAEKRKERERGAVDLQSAKASQKKRQGERQEKLLAQEKRTRDAEKKIPSMGLPKILLGARKRNAQKTASKLKIQEDHLVESSVENLNEVIEAQKKEKLLYFELPQTEFPQGKQLMRLEGFNFRFSEKSPWLWGHDLNFSFKGGVRLALKGENGTGKTTLLKLLMGKGPAGLKKGTIEFANSPKVFLDQNYESLDLGKSVLENVFEFSRYGEVETRNLLARFLFQKEQVHQEAGSLSGGERMRASLAKALLAKEVPQILILDEPTNNLDLESVLFLEGLLRKFQGALIVVSHDEDFLKEISCVDVLSLSQNEN